MTIETSLKPQKASIADVPQIHGLVSHYAQQGDLLFRPLGEIYETLRDFFVFREDGKVVACGALHIYWEDLAEVKSLAVASDMQGRGLGQRIVGACLAEAQSLGIPAVFALTLRPGFFEKLGFQRVDLMDLPRKVFHECLRCSKIAHCNEIAVIRRLG
ncbi:MAG: N-acetyltransferase [Chloroflexi bacterium]|nr:N-acetyltransferase [Chloroflexota bacterium]